MKEKVILLFKIPSDHLEICNPVIYDVREIFFDEPNKNEKARKKKLITSNVSHVQNTMSKISTIVNICYKKNCRWRKMYGQPKNQFNWAICLRPSATSECAHINEYDLHL